MKHNNRTFSAAEERCNKILAWTHNLAGSELLPTPNAIKFSEGALELYLEFVNNNRVRAQFTPYMEDVVREKINKLCHRLALILHAIRYPESEQSGSEFNTVVTPKNLVIESDTIVSAKKLATWFLTQSMRAYQRLELEGSIIEAIEMASWIRKRGGSVTARDIVRGIW